MLNMLAYPGYAIFTTQALVPPVVTFANNASPTTENLECEVQLMEIGSPENSNAKSETSEKVLAAKQRMIKMIPHEIATQLGAKLSTLFALFVKMSVGGSVRPRQSGFSRNNLTQTPSESARALADMLAKHINDTLLWTPPLESPTSRFRFSFFTCAVQLSSQLLMDDVRSPYHLMLQHLLSQKGEQILEKALYEGVKAATGKDLDEILCQDELPPGCAEYLAEWLFLMEKLIDTSRILESRYGLPAKYDPDNYHVPFRPGRYLVTVHQIAFSAVKKLWGKNALKGYKPKPNAPKLLETLLAVLRHIIKSEEQIQKQVDKENKEDDENPNRLMDALNKRWDSTKFLREIAPEFRLNLDGAAGSSASESHREYRAELAALISRQGLGEGLAGEAVPGDPYTNAMQLLHQRYGDIISGAPGSMSPTVPPIPDIALPPTATPPAAVSDAARTQRVTALVSMGYPERLANRAVDQCRSLETAVDYCLNHTDEDDELAMAIQMSLEPSAEMAEEPPADEDVPPEEPAPPAVNEAEEAAKKAAKEAEQKKLEEDLKKSINQTVQDEQKRKMQESKMKALDQTRNVPITRDEIYKFSYNMIGGCLQLLDDDPDTVYRISDLLIVTIRRNGQSWMKGKHHNCSDESLFLFLFVECPNCFIISEYMKSGSFSFCIFFLHFKLMVSLGSVILGVAYRVVNIR